jgi:GTP-binding protein EngB required for normal cell division
MNNIKVEKNIDYQDLESILMEFEKLILPRLDLKEIDILNQLKEKLSTNTVNFAVVGQFKRGKSSFINALLGHDILPTAVVPVTSVITIVKYSDDLFSKVFFENGNSSEIELAELKSFIAESENPGNIKKVKYIEIGFPNILLKQGMMFIDTPGIGSLHLNNTLSTYEYLPKIDAAIFITSSDPAISEIEIKLLDEILNVTPNIFFILNKIDYLDGAEIDEVIAYMKSHLNSRFIKNEITLFPVSSRIALNSKINNDNHSLEQSGLINFENHLLKYFYSEKENILITSVKRQLINLIKEIEMGLELEAKSLLLPIEELKIKQKTLIESLDYFSKDDLIFLNKIRNDIKLLISTYNKQFYKIISDICYKIRHEILKYEKHNKFLKKSEYKSGINKLFTDLIINELESNRNILENEIKEKSKSIFREAFDNYNSIINRIYLTASKLFDINLKEIHYEKEYEIPSNVEYITYELKLMFNINKSTFAFMLPRRIHNKIITKKFIERIDFTINYNSSYITDSIEKRLERTLIAYNIVFKKEIKDTIEKIKDIIHKVRLLKENEVSKSDILLEKLNEKMRNIKELRNYLINNTSNDTAAG